MQPLKLPVPQDSTRALRGEIVHLAWRRVLHPADPWHTHSQFTPQKATAVGVVIAFSFSVAPFPPHIILTKCRKKTHSRLLWGESIPAVAYIHSSSPRHNISCKKGGVLPLPLLFNHPHLFSLSFAATAAGKERTHSLLCVCVCFAFSIHACVS